MYSPEGLEDSPLKSCKSHKKNETEHQTFSFLSVFHRKLLQKVINKVVDTYFSPNLTKSKENKSE